MTCRPAHRTVSSHPARHAARLALVIGFAVAVFFGTAPSRAEDRSAQILQQLNDDIKEVTDTRKAFVDQVTQAMQDIAEILSAMDEVPPGSPEHRYLAALGIAEFAKIYDALDQHAANYLRTISRFSDGLVDARSQFHGLQTGMVSYGGRMAGLKASGKRCYQELKDIRTRISGYREQKKQVPQNLVISFRNKMHCIKAKKRELTLLRRREQMGRIKGVFYEKVGDSLGGMIRAAATSTRLNIQEMSQYLQSMHDTASTQTDELKALAVFAEGQQQLFTFVKLINRSTEVFNTGVLQGQTSLETVSARLTSTDNIITETGQVNDAEIEASMRQAEELVNEF